MGCQPFLPVFGPNSHEIPSFAIALCLDRQSKLINASSELLSSRSNLFVGSPRVVSERGFSVNVSKSDSGAEKSVTTSGPYNFFEVIEVG